MPERDKNFSNKDNLPKHIAIIPDGNRRWAKTLGKGSSFGHEKGVEILEKITNEAFSLGITHLTAWGCSVSNISGRPKAEVVFLYRLFKRMFGELLKEKKIDENETRVEILGRWREKFPKPLVSVMEKVIKKTARYSKKRLTYLMAYDGRDEMAEAIKKISRQYLKAFKSSPNISYDSIKQNLWTHDLPPVDLVIRTGGEPHWSAGFMMWDTAESQFYFTEKYWPEFEVAEFHKALHSYAQRERRMGK